MARTAITLTVKTTNSSGKRGISTSAAAAQAEPKQREIKRPRIAQRPVQAVAGLHHFAERVGGRSGDGNRGDDAGFENAESEKRGAGVADQRLERFGELRRLENRRR